jgi:hypothetical protein
MQKTAHTIQNLRRPDPEWLACPDMALEGITSQRYLCNTSFVEASSWAKPTEMITKTKSTSAALEHVTLS